jgi:Transglutaminase-like superfamily
MLRKLFLLSFFMGWGFLAQAQQTRHFTFHYEFSVRNVTPGAPLRVWIPLAHSDEFQTVRVLKTAGDLPLRRTQEKEYGNQMLYASTQKAGKAEYKFAADYDVVRREHLSPQSTARVNPLPAGERRRFLEADKLVPVTGLPADLASKETASVTNDEQKAHAIYNYVLANMRYDKTCAGWGHGDTLYACSAKKGNCTDFHSLFISMARSQGIPARFEIGFPLPADKSSSEVAGYHCWAEYYSAERGWVPVDISEAWKHADKRGYFFGAHDDNRMQFTVGRDLTLNPPQAGPPLNYFVYPYVEVDGKEFSNVANSFSFHDIPENGKTVSSARVRGGAQAAAHHDGVVNP